MGEVVYLPVVRIERKPNQTEEIAGAPARRPSKSDGNRRKLPPVLPKPEPEKPDNLA